MSFPEIIETVRIGLMKAGLVTLASILGGGALFALWRTVRRPIVTTWRLLGRPGKVVVTSLCAVCIFLAGGKNEGLRGTGDASVTPEEIAQGYRLESAVTNDAVSYSMPTDGVVVYNFILVFQSFIHWIRRFINAINIKSAEI